MDSPAPALRLLTRGHPCISFVVLVKRAVSPKYSLQSTQIKINSHMGEWVCEIAGRPGTNRALGVEGGGGVPLVIVKLKRP